MDWFLYDINLRHERVNCFLQNFVLDVWQGSAYPWEAETWLIPSK